MPLLNFICKEKNLAELIADLKFPAESKEYRLKIVGAENFKNYGQKVLDDFKRRAVAKGLKIAEPNFEGVRLNFDDGWALLRLSLHDPLMPLNIESKSKGGCKKISLVVKELLTDFNSLDTKLLSDLTAV